MKKTIPWILVSLLGLLIFTTCNTGVEPSPEPGLLRVTLQSAPDDTSIIVNADTFYTTGGDSFRVTIFQGKAYVESDWAILYKDTSRFREEEHHYNILRQRDGSFTEYTIFESFLPPDTYDTLQFGISASFMLLTYGFDHGGLPVPMELPPGASPVVNLETDYTIESGKVTEVGLQISPFESVTRFRDLFHFTPEIQVTGVSRAGNFR